DDSHAALEVGGADGRRTDGSRAVPELVLVDRTERDDRDLMAPVRLPARDAGTPALGAADGRRVPMDHVQDSHRTSSPAAWSTGAWGASDTRASTCHRSLVSLGFQLD